MANRHNVKGGPAEPVQVMNTDITTSPIWRAIKFESATIHDSDKAFSVPAGQEYQVLNVWVKYVSSATVGDRQLAVEFRDQLGNVIAELRAGAVQAASVTRYYQFNPSSADLTAFRDTDFIMNPLPIITLPETYNVRVWDRAAISGAGDTMTVQLLVNYRNT